MQYNFEKLENNEFEHFCKDLISEIDNKEYKIYAYGKDGGIDFKSELDGVTIGQVKHFINSTSSSLLSEMRKEKLKMDVHKPDRYIFLTSHKMTPMLENSIFEIMKPYIRTKDDIYGIEQIDSLVDKYPNVRKKYFKLWLSNTDIISEMIFKAEKNNIKHKIEEIISKKNIYVYTKRFDSALKILKNEKILVISGEPGIGKTTLAEMLTLFFIDAGYSLKFVDSNKIEAIDKILDFGSTTKEIVFIDDFLGSNYLKYFKYGNEGDELIEFIKKIRFIENKYIVLTTRVTIINMANLKSEKFSKLNLKHYLLELNFYSNEDKSKILYNHLKYSGLKLEYIEEILKDKRYRKIVLHKNYFPRLIEFICNENEYNEKQYINYFDFVIKNMDNPHEIWGKAFENNIECIDRLFLLTLYSFGGKIDEEQLKDAFYKRLELENISFETNIFEITLKHLMIGFIKIQIEDVSKVRLISFLNPSITDYLLGKYSKNKIETVRIIKSAKYIQQIEYILEVSQKDFEFTNLVIKRINEIEFNGIESKLMFLESINNSTISANIEIECLKILKEIIQNKIELKKLSILRDYFYNFRHYLLKKSKYFEEIKLPDDFIIKLKNAVFRDKDIFKKILFQIKDCFDYYIFFKLFENELNIKDFIEFEELFIDKTKEVLLYTIKEYNINELLKDEISEISEINDIVIFEKENYTLNINKNEFERKLKEQFDIFEDTIDNFDTYIVAEAEYESDDFKKLNDIKERISEITEDSMSKYFVFDWEFVEAQLIEEYKEKNEVNDNYYDDYDKIDYNDKDEIDRIFENF